MLSVNPIRLLVLVAVINGVVAAPFLLILMRVAGNRTIMGNYANRGLAKALGWITATVMALAAVLLIVTFGLSL
jgi:Mn2+/Fe2+ NRAMP family transporter